MAKAQRDYEFSRITISSAMCREETLEGRQCLVFPMAMMPEGVHNGSSGPVYYSAKVLGKMAAGWNMKPVIVGHPMDGDTPLSACSADIINQSSVGVILNAKFESGKLRGEAWIYRDKADSVAPGLIDNLQSGRMMELSIGCFTTVDGKEGEWNGEKFTASVSAIMPDHLALLPDGVGAASVADGAGIPRIYQRFTACAQQSFSEINSALWEAGKSLGLDAGTGDGISACFCIEAVFPETVIYCDAAGELKRYAYTANDDGTVTVVNEPADVRRVVTYEPKETETAALSTVTTLEETIKPMSMKDILTRAGIDLAKLGADALAAIESIPESVVAQIETAFGADAGQAEADAAAAQAEVDAAAEAAQAQAVADAAAASTTDAPPVVSEQAPTISAAEIAELTALRDRERGAAVARITANKANQFTAAELAAMSLGQLTKLARFAYTPAASIAPLTDNSEGGAAPVQILPPVTAATK